MCQISKTFTNSARSKKRILYNLLALVARQPFKKPAAMHILNVYSFFSELHVFTLKAALKLFFSILERMGQGWRFKFQITTRATM